MKLFAVVLVVVLLGACAASNRPLQLLSGQGPIYPAAARSQGLEGVVIVRYDVSVEGVVQNVAVVSSEPADIFDAAALAAVHSWRFNAPLVEGVKQPARNRQSSVEFRLSGGDSYENY
jgi:TonB family protein